MLNPFRAEFHFDRLKSAVKDLAQKGRLCQSQVTALRRARPPRGDVQRYPHGLRIHTAVTEKRGFGYCSRYHQLAWAFVRRVSYARVESPHTTNPPSAHIILDVLADFAVEPLNHGARLASGMPAQLAQYLDAIRDWLAPAASARDVPLQDTENIRRVDPPCAPR